MSVHVAVDLGASSGRVMIARVTGGPSGGVALDEVHRFSNEPVPLWENGYPALHWDVARLFAEILTGLRAVRGRLAAGEHVDSIGIDSWAVDYGLLDARGALLVTPYCYRDERTTVPGGGVERVHAVVPHEELYVRNGLQFLPFNTLYQLAAEPADRLGAASAMLLLPDLLTYWLTGVARGETTNASTTGLLDVRTGEWDIGLAARLGLSPAILPPLVRPGEAVGTLLPHVAEATGLPASTPVVAVGSHDTASAVVAVPATGERFAYISSGTWSLVGVELKDPVLTDAGRAANFTNEGGVDAWVRYLRNVMGLWLLSETLRTWDRAGTPTDLASVLAAAAEVADGGPVVDVDDPVFLPPGDMPARISRLCAATGQPPPQDRPALVRCLLDSLAAAYARAVDDATRLSGRDVDVVHVVGGGSLNTLLCRLTARATGRPVVAGPVEATALGSALVQARAVGTLRGDLGDLRSLLRSEPLAHYDPDHHPDHHPDDHPDDHPDHPVEQPVTHTTGRTS